MQLANNSVHESGIHQRTITRNPHNCRRAGDEGNLVIPIEDIVFLSSMDLVSQSLNISAECFVTLIKRSSDGNLVNSRGSGQALQKQADQRNTTDPLHDFV